MNQDFTKASIICPKCGNITAHTTASFTAPSANEGASLTARAEVALREFGELIEDGTLSHGNSEFYSDSLKPLKEIVKSHTQLLAALQSIDAKSLEVLASMANAEQCPLARALVQPMLNARAAILKATQL